ncbi:MAG: DUF86 domain-containing protein [Armatimonadetes bacterium]|nr:DUF86 domain-containing protein [Armatimonadota bacterium]
MDTSAIDQRVVAGLTGIVRRSVARLEALAALPPESFAADADCYAIAEHHLRLGLEASMDLGRHLIARLGLGAATDYSSVPRSLESAQIVPPELAATLMRSARLRNRLVHL